MNQSINTQDTFEISVGFPDYCREHKLTDHEFWLLLKAISFFTRCEGILPDSYFTIDGWAKQLDATVEEFAQMLTKNVFEFWDQSCGTFQPAGYGKVWA